VELREGIQIFLADAACGHAAGHRSKFGSHLNEVRNRSFRPFRNERAAIGHELHVSVGRQLTQRFADGRAADADLLRNLLLAQMEFWRKVAVENAAANSLVGLACCFCHNAFLGLGGRLIGPSEPAYSPFARSEAIKSGSRSASLPMPAPPAV